MCHATNITSIEGQRRDALDVVALPDWQTYPYNRAAGEYRAPGAGSSAA